MNTTVKKPINKVATKKTTAISDYTKNVINTNKNLKNEFKTLGGCLKQLYFFKDEMQLNPVYVAIIKFLREDTKAYEEFKKVCRTSKKGNYAPFFVLQAIHKSQKLETKIVKKSAKKLKPLESMTIKELESMLALKKITVKNNMKKADLIEALKTAK